MIREATETPEKRKTPDFTGVFQWWWGKDSNLGRRKPADLQSALNIYFIGIFEKMVANGGLPLPILPRKWYYCGT